MESIFSPVIFLYLIPGAFAAIGGVLAYNRGRNPFFWAIGSALFPICIMIVWFEKPKKEVEGHFRKCCHCREWIKWKESPCRYCRTLQQG